MNKTLAIALVALGLFLQFRPEDTKEFATSQPQLWNDFADWVEANPSGQVRDTDFVLQMARALRDSGRIEDISRLDEFAQSYQEIDSGNRSQIASVVRGE